MKTKIKIKPEQIDSIINAAKLAASIAAADYSRTAWDGNDCGACGFAWVNIRGIHGNSKLAKVLAEYGITKDYSGALCWWNPSGYHGQNIDCKEHGAEAAAMVLRTNGFDAVSRSRLD